MGQIETFLVAATEADGVDALNAAFLREAMALGYHSFDAFSHPMIENTRRPHKDTILTASYNIGILEPYLKGGLSELCPALLRIAKTFVPFDYVDFLKRSPPNRSVKWQLMMLKLYGVRRAWCVPVSTIGVLQCVTVYMRGRSEAKAAAFEATREDILLLSQAYMEALLTLHPQRRTAVDQETASPDLLTAREIDCLTWVRHGKTNEEIAEILGISVNTVNFHMKNVLRKLEAPNRTRAAGRAEALGLLASPPPDRF